MTAESDGHPPFLSQLSVRGLFGFLDYDLEPKNREKLDSLFFLLYGENGSGKSTLLRIVFHLLGPSDGLGHRTFLAKCKFRLVKLTLLNNAVVEAVRPEGLLVGAFQYSVILPNGKRITAQIGVNAEGNVTNQTCQRLEDVALALHSLGLSLFYVSEDRQIEIDGPDAPDRRSRLLLEEPRVRQTDLAELNPNKISRLLLNRSLQSATEFLRSRGLQAVGKGEMSTHGIYLNIVRTLSTKRPKQSRRIAPNDFYKRLAGLLSRSADFAKYGFIQRIDVKEWINLLDSFPPRRRASLVHMLEPFADSLEARYTALEPLQQLTDNYIVTLNSYFTRKYVTFDFRKGLGIQSDSGDSLPPELLSSGERQLLLLFSRVLISTGRSSLYIIDEPELSLNVTWQRRLLASLLAIAPVGMVQFLMATHSIEILTNHLSSTARLDELPNRSRT